MGHAAGDDVLREVAQRLLGRTRKSDTVGRLGGDEFIVVLPEFDDEGHVQLVAQKLLATVTTPPIMAAGRASGVSLSIGIATFPNDGSAIAPLLAAADAALYEAKRLGKNRFAIKTQRR
jgi:diguanylate cyclase (GGDEF)-like protein